MANDIRIRESIASVAEAYKAAHNVVVRLSVAGDRLGLPYPRRASRMQKAVYLFARVADWFEDIANNLPTIEAVHRLDDETLAAIDRLAVVRRIHHDPGVLAPELSAVARAIPSIMAAACTGNPLRRFAFNLVGESSKNLYEPDSLRLVADKLLHLDSGVKYSEADELKHYIELQWSEAESWDLNYLAIESALRRELYEAEGSSTEAARSEKRKPRSDAPSEKLVKQVRKWRQQTAPEPYEVIRELLHSSTFKRLLPATKRDKTSYPSDRQIQIWCKEQSPTHEDGAN
jgi:hypothetical protein